MSKQPSEDQDFRGKGFVDPKSVRAAQELVDQISRVPPETWQYIADSTRNLKDLTESGGVGAIFTDFKQAVADTFSENLNSLLAPLKNEIGGIVDGVFAEVIIKLGLDKFINDVTNFIGGNSTGAFFGALIGSIKGPIGAVVGAVIGAGIQKDIDELIAMMDNTQSFDKGLCNVLRAISKVLTGVDPGPCTEAGDILYTGPVNIVEEDEDKKQFNSGGF